MKIRTMTIEPLISILIALLLIAVREGLVIADMQDNTYKSKILSGWWHKMGLVIRGFLILAVFLMVQEHYGYRNWIFWGYVGASFALASVWYNIAINLITGKKWYYLSDKGIDGLIKKLFFLLVLLLPFAFKAQQPHVYTVRFTMSKPVSNNQVVDIRFTQATDPDRMPVTHKIVGGTGRKYFYTTQRKGGIYIGDAKAINKSGIRQYTLVMHAWDPTRLTSINNITIYVK